MKHIVLFVPLLVFGALLTPSQAAALSCLETSMYLDSVVGEEEVVIFTGTVTDTIETDEYTAEVLDVTTASQGYVEKSVMVYHEKHPDWGYLCNTGPAEAGVTSTYIATRNNIGQYQVTMRLETDSELTEELEFALGAEEIVGEVTELTPTDRQNQIMTTIMDLFKQISLLLKEHVYWANMK